jgi:TolB-like protein/DNA-binding winged helix-turn-helix (wHTH) protein/Flp pilus assembly protein TadD
MMELRDWISRAHAAHSEMVYYLGACRCPMKEMPRLTAPVRFGIFEVHAGELRRSGAKIKLQEQPLQILLMLLERPGEVVAREELQKRLWPADTFVDFDRGLNRAVNKLREALGDDSENPRYVETLARRGYRFIGPVEPPKSHDSLPAGGAGRPGKSHQKRWMIAASVAIATLLLLSLGFNAGGIRDRLLGRGARPRIESLAVLPLQNLSSDPAQEYFADGMTDGLITEVARIGSLRVISRTSIMQYKRAHKPLPLIARELGVDAVVEGTITYAGQKVRITAQLIRASDDRHLWSEKYERDLGDALKLQGEVAQAIAEQIQIKLTSREHRTLLRERHVEPRAYEAYVEGSYFGSKVSEDSLNKSVALMAQAIQIDPNYAQGYAGLSHSYYVMGMLGFQPAEGAYSKAKTAARKALELDESLAEAHNTLAEVKRGYYWDWAGAESEFRRALQLSPNYSLAHSGYASVLSNMGRHEEAIVEARRSRELDPVSVSSNTALGRILFRARKYDDSIKACRKAVELDPNDASPLWWMALSHERKGELAEAIVELEKAVALSGAGTLSRGLLANAYALLGEKKKALSTIEEFRELSKRKYVSPVDIAIVYAGLGDRNSAFLWLEKAYQEHTMRIQELPEPLFDTLRSDQRYRDLMRRLGLPE